MFSEGHFDLRCAQLLDFVNKLKTELRKQLILSHLKSTTS